MSVSEKTPQRKRPPARVGLPVRGFPLELKRQLGAIAEAEQTNLNDVAVAILASRMKVRYERQKRPSAGLSDSTYVTLEMPEPLRAKIKVAAARQRTSAQALVIQELSDHLNGS